MNESTIIGILILLAGLLFGTRRLAKSQKGKRPGRPDKPADPPRPNTAELDRAEAVADHERKSVEKSVADAVEGKSDADNPHGLADAANKRRR